MRLMPKDIWVKMPADQDMIMMYTYRLEQEHIFVEKNLL